MKSDLQSLKLWELSQCYEKIWFNGSLAASYHGMVYLYFLNQEFTFGFHEKIK